MSVINIVLSKFMPPPTTGANPEYILIGGPPHSLIPKDRDGQSTSLGPNPARGAAFSTHACYSSYKGVIFLKVWPEGCRKFLKRPAD